MFLIFDCVDNITAVHDNELPETNCNDKPSTSADVKPVIGKKRKVTMDDMNEKHLEVIELEKEKLRHEIANAILKKKKIQLEIEIAELRKEKLLHEI